MILLFSIPQACLSYLVLGGIFALGSGLGYVICNVLDNDPTANLSNKLINNREALDLIDRFQQSAGQNNTVSGHLELGVLLTYINKVQDQCRVIGMKLSGLEYYFAKYDGQQNNNDDSGRSTVVIYPTYEDDNGDHIPFDPFASVSGSNPVTVVDMNSVSASSRTGVEYDSNWVLDRSNMSPPRKPTF